MTGLEYRWNEWNLDHATRHGISPAEAEYVADNARPPYPERTVDDKWLVRGAGFDGGLIQVVYVVDPDGTRYIIHARPLTGAETT